jgi:YfiH family protein
VSIKWFNQTSIKIGSSQLPLSFDNKSLSLNSSYQDTLGVSKLAVVTQVHGNDILEFSYQELLLGCKMPVNNLGQADAIVIGEVNFPIKQAATIAVGIRTADCLPIVVQSPCSIALLHAGWRGLAAGIIERVFSKLQTSESGVDELRCFIGPAAKDCCYEVGSEVLNACGLSSKACESKEKIDLQKLAEARMKALSKKCLIEIDDRCTICSHLLHSYRRNNSELRNMTFVLI